MRRVFFSELNFSTLILAVSEQEHVHRPYEQYLSVYCCVWIGTPVSWQHAVNHGVFVLLLSAESLSKVTSQLQLSQRIYEQTSASIAEKPTSARFLQLGFSLQCSYMRTLLADPELSWASVVLNVVSQCKDEDLCLHHKDVFSTEVKLVCYHRACVDRFYLWCVSTGWESP